MVAQGHHSIAHQYSGVVQVFAPVSLVACIVDAEHILDVVHHHDGLQIGEHPDVVAQDHQVVEIPFYDVLPLHFVVLAEGECLVGDLLHRLFH